MNAKKTRILVTALAVFAGAAGAHEAHHEHHAVAPVASQAVADAALKPLAARFELKSGNLKTDWYLWREADRIETADTASAQGNIWERLGQNDFGYRRVFHADQRVVEYTPGELRTRHAEPDWVKLASLVSPQLLASLKRGGSAMQLGQKAVRYSGTVDGQKIELLWLEQAQLPARLQIVGKTQRMTLSLKEIHAQAPAAWPRASEERIAAYAKIDAADFGDMESDPFVARVMRQDGDHHAH